MIIEEYFRRLSDIINASPLMGFTRISFDKRGAHVGFIRGELTFIDGSTLHIREYVDVGVSVERFMYAYQYMDREGGLFFRYDNTGHHRGLNLPTCPHHKHERNEEHVIASQAPSLEDGAGGSSDLCPIAVRIGVRRCAASFPILIPFPERFAIANKSGLY